MDAGELTADMTPYTESYEHFDEVGMRIRDLPAEWEAAKARDRRSVTPETAWVVETRETTAPQWKAWDVATGKDMKRIYYDMKSVSRTDDLGGPVREGSQYHCVHELGDVRFTITDWNPPHSFASDEVALEIPIEFTMQIIPTGAGSTLRIMYGEPELPDPDEAKPMFEEAASGALDRLVAILEGSLPDGT